MDVFVHRNPVGCETFDLEGIEELEEQLKAIDTFKPLDDEEQILVEISGPWGEIRDLLSQPFFNKIWFDPTSPKYKQ